MSKSNTPNRRRPPPFRDLWLALSADEKKEMAKRTQCSYDFLKQLAHGHRAAGVEAIKKICRDPRVTPRMLRPDLPDETQP